MIEDAQTQSAGLPESAGDLVTRAFIGHAMKVHTAVGPGLGEEVYHQELVQALTKAGIAHLSKPRRDLVYRGIVADTFEPDFVIEEHFIPELKCLRGSFAAEHLVQVFCYCKFWRLRTSLLVDFGKQSLMWKRLMYRSQSAGFTEAGVPGFVSDPVLAETIMQAVSRCLDEVGLGYRQTTWKGLVRAAIQAAGSSQSNCHRSQSLWHYDVQPCHQQFLCSLCHGSDRRYQCHGPSNPSNSPPLAEPWVGHRLSLWQIHCRLRFCPAPKKVICCKLMINLFTQSLRAKGMRGRSFIDLGRPMAWVLHALVHSKKSAGLPESAGCQIAHAGPTRMFPSKFQQIQKSPQINR